MVGSLIPGKFGETTTSDELHRSNLPIRICNFLVKHRVLLARRFQRHRRVVAAYLVGCLSLELNCFRVVARLEWMDHSRWVVQWDHLCPCLPFRMWLEWTSKVLVDVWAQWLLKGLLDSRECFNNNPLCRECLRCRCSLETFNSQTCMVSRHLRAISQILVWCVANQTCLEPSSPQVVAINSEQQTLFVDWMQACNHSSLKQQLVVHSKPLGSQCQWLHRHLWTLKGRKMLSFELCRLQWLARKSHLLHGVVQLIRYVPGWSR